VPRKSLFQAIPSVVALSFKKKSDRAIRLQAILRSFSLSAARRVAISKWNSKILIAPLFRRLLPAEFLPLTETLKPVTSCPGLISEYVGILLLE
jgi:hypothetical protein